MKIQLTDHFDYRRLLRFSLPTIIMIICTSIYCIVDGFFVSNVVGKTAFASINLIMPVLIGVGSIGLMFGTGGSAMIAKLMGQKKQEEAQSCFSMLVYMAIIIGIFVSFIGFIFTRPVFSCKVNQGYKPACNFPKCSCYCGACHTPLA